MKASLAACRHDGERNGEQRRIALGVGDAAVERVIAGGVQQRRVAGKADLVHHADDVDIGRLVEVVDAHVDPARIRDRWVDEHVVAELELHRIGIAAEAARGLVHGDRRRRAFIGRPVLNEVVGNGQAADPTTDNGNVQCRLLAC
jgi:hypothetical protein